MNFIEAKFTELRDKQIAVLYEVCTYIQETLELSDFYIYNVNSYYERDAFINEINIESVEDNRVISLYGSFGESKESLQELKHIETDLIQLLIIMTPSASLGVRFIIGDTLETFSKQFSNQEMCLIN
jgi:hypothetical protein